jgi:hypothetical protein
MLLSAHLRAGRALIDMSQLELSVISDVSLPSIKKFENDDEALLNANQRTIRKLISTLESKGVSFGYKKDENGRNVVIVKLIAIDKKFSEE